MLTAEELHRRGVAAINDGRVRRAQHFLELARTRTEHQNLLARVEASLAYATADMGDPDAALLLGEQALRRPGIHRETRGIVQGQRALLLMRRGLGTEALVAFDEAIDCLAEVPAEQAKVFINRGGVHLQIGDARLAAADFSVAITAFGSVGDGLNAAKSEHNLGYARLLTGDVVGAIDAMGRAFPVIAPVSPVLRAICQQDRAEALLAAGLLDEGTKLLAEAARTYGDRGLRQRQGEAELALARRILVLSPERAGTWARRAARRFQRLGVDSWRLRAEAVDLASTPGSGHRRHELPPAGLATDLEAHGFRWTGHEVRLHQARLGLHADHGIAPDLPPSRRGREAPLEVRLLDREVRAEAAAIAGRLGQALAHLRAGLDDLQAWRSSFGSLDLQTGVASRGVVLGVRGLVLAAGSRKPAVLLEWSERARMLASRVQPVRAPEDEQIVADLAELRTEPSPKREAELRQRIRERAWQHRGSGEVAEPVTLAELRTALDADTALVAYVVTADSVVALVVTAEGPTWVDLGGRGVLDALLGGLLPDLDVAAADLPEPMAGAVRGALADRLTRLADLLVTPVLAAVGERRVVLTPSGVLAGVPWTLLPGYVGRPVTVAQSATSWLLRRTTPLRTATAGFVAGPRVVRAEDEVNAAAREWSGAQILVGAAATAAAVSELAERVDVLHVAAHGRHSSENPLFSGLELADGSWFGYDVDRLRAVPDVVLLSACEVGRSTVRGGEELIGMTAAWLHAGARCVIASAAAVNDAAAYDVLVAVHRQLAAGVDPAVALAAAVPAVSTGTAPVPLVCFG